MNDSLLIAVEPLAECTGDWYRYEVIDISTVLRDFAHEAAAYVAQIGAAWKIHGANAGYGVVVVSHLLFDLEVSGRSQTLDYEISSCPVGRLDREAGMRLNCHMVEMGQSRLGHFDSFVDCEEARWLCQIVHYCDNDRPKEFVSLLDDVDVPEVDRVEAARVERS
jgi:hypothetical protein